MLKYLLAVIARLLPSVARAALLLSLSTPAVAAEPDLIEGLGSEARVYASELAQDQTADYSPAERVNMRLVADTLLRHHHCDTAQGLAKQIASGLSAIPTGDWLRMGQAAVCTKSWKDAIAAAWLGAHTPSDQYTQHAVLVLLGTALEGHSQYGTRYALAAYQKALTYGISTAIQDKVRTLEQILAAEQELRVDKFLVQQEASKPALCLDFSATMPEPTKQNYRDFIRFAPSFTAKFRLAASNEICADGATFGTTYEVQILPGLVADNGVKVPKPIQYDVDAGDRPSALWFGNSRYILPIGGGVPIYGVNVAQTSLTLYKIADRNLLQEDVREMFRTDLSTWQTQRIRDQLGEQVWKGEADLTLTKNQETITNLPMVKYMPQEPGVYILTAIPKKTEAGAVTEESSNNQAALWLLVSDIGITSYQGADGLTIVTRSLATGKPMGGVHLALYARNNRLLGDAVADGAGVAKIPVAALRGNGGREPVTLMATGPGTDFNFLDISTAPYDLSDRGVAGRQAPGPMDAFLYTERGVYRPGEMVHTAALLRNNLGQALEDSLPLTLRLLRPDNQIAEERVVNTQGAGGYSLTFQLSPNARTGHWKVQAFLDPKANAIGTVEFQIEAIVPPRLELNVAKPPPSPMQPGVIAPFEVQASYLFGAPGADLAVTGEVRISADPNPFPTFLGYQFGPVDEASDSVLQTLTATRTDAKGHAQFAVNIERLPELEQPLRATLRAEVTDVDGRAVNTSYDVPVRQKPLYIGIKAPGDAGRIQEGAEAKFQVVAVNPTGQAIPLTGLSYRLVEEQADYQWYLQGSRWQFKNQVRDHLLQEGQLAVTAAAPASLGLPLTYGSYRLEVKDPAHGIISSARVEVGWGNSNAEAETPDRLILRADRKDYRPGEVAKLTIQSPFVGAASLVVATDKVLSIQALTLTGHNQVVEVPVDATWGGGSYALVTAYRPDAGTAGHGPRRAVGIAWLSVAKDLHQIVVSIAAPAQIRPRHNLDVKLQAGNPLPNEAIYMTLAAVDEGVLRLTDYQNPDPLEYYFGQRTLDVGLRDLYGRLIDGHEGTPGVVRSGGDKASSRGAPDTNIHIVSLFSGVVKLNKDGWAEVPLAIPDFNGRLRLMAVAWSEGRVGESAVPVTVRDPVVLMPSIPRFLAVGDQSQASLLINNVEGATGDYHLKWSAGGVISLGDGATETVLKLAPGDHKVVTVPMQANNMGKGTLHLRLTAPTGEILERDAQIGVRVPFLPESQRLLGRLHPGDSVNLGAYVTKGLRPETVTGLLSVSVMPALDVPGLLRQLDLYPYGCLEQVTSIAFPLLHIERLGSRWGYNSKAPVAQRLLDAVTHLLEKQQDSGGFSLWSSDGDEEPWLSAYAMDFLQQAKAAGVEVPDFMWNRGLEWLRRQVAAPETTNPLDMAVQTYALYLLTKNGETPEETARYLLDQMGEKLPSRLAAAQLGAALAKMGDQERAARAFALAGRLPRNETVHDYGSSLRDLAAIVTIMTEAGQSGQEALAWTLTQELTKNRGLSTQEQAWLVRAADSLTDDPAPLAVKIQGIAMPLSTTPLVRTVTATVLAQGLNLRNVGTTGAWYSLAVDGSPILAPPPLTQGLYLERSLLDLSGVPVNPQSIPQGAVMVVMLEGNTTTQDIDHQTLILDPLPAGLEIENPNLAHAATAGNLEWIGKLTDTNYSEALDDRFVAALNLNNSGRSFKLAYLVRAVSPGYYVAPPPVIEDMYRPSYRGRGQSGWVRVIPAQ